MHNLDRSDQKQELMSSGAYNWRVKCIRISKLEAMKWAFEIEDKLDSLREAEIGRWAGFDGG
jgi:hypothetical protein